MKRDPFPGFNPMKFILKAGEIVIKKGVSWEERRSRCQKPKLVAVGGSE
jgi:hypothetical protein